MNFARDRPRDAMAWRRSTRAMYPPVARRGVWHRLGRWWHSGEIAHPRWSSPCVLGRGGGHAYRGARGGGACRALAQRSACMCQMRGGISRDSAACCADDLHRPVTRTGRDTDTTRRASAGATPHVATRGHTGVCHARVCVTRAHGHTPHPTSEAQALRYDQHGRARRVLRAAAARRQGRSGVGAMCPAALHVVAPRVVPTPRAAPTRIGPAPPHALAAATGRGPCTPRRESARATPHVAMPAHKDVGCTCVRHTRPWLRPAPTTPRHGPCDEIGVVWRSACRERPLCGGKGRAGRGEV